MLLPSFPLTMMLTTIHIMSFLIVIWSDQIVLGIIKDGIILLIGDERSECHLHDSTRFDNLHDVYLTGKLLTRHLQLSQSFRLSTAPLAASAFS